VAYFAAATPSQEVDSLCCFHELGAGSPPSKFPPLQAPDRIPSLSLRWRRTSTPQSFYICCFFVHRPLPPLFLILFLCLYPKCTVSLCVHVGSRRENCCCAGAGVLNPVLLPSCDVLLSGSLSCHTGTFSFCSFLFPGTHSFISTSNYPPRRSARHTAVLFIFGKLVGTTADDAVQWVRPLRFSEPVVAVFFEG